MLVGAGMIYLGAVGIFYQRALMGDADLMELVPIWVLCGALILSGIGLPILGRWHRPAAPLDSSFPRWQLQLPSVAGLPSLCGSTSPLWQACSR